MAEALAVAVIVKDHHCKMVALMRRALALLAKQGKQPK